MRNSQSTQWSLKLMISSCTMQIVVSSGNCLQYISPVVEIGAQHVPYTEDKIYNCRVVAHQ